ncbi:MAG: hypothetical protein P4M15_02220 [Alphaproteobacteria bacterium]|nr:hypothetical protein [Alphaproteobacteria bacterium]
MTNIIDVFRSRATQNILQAFALTATAILATAPDALASSRHPSPAFSLFPLFASQATHRRNQPRKPLAAKPRSQKVAPRPAAGAGGGDFDCAVHTAAGEAPDGDVVEAAVIVNGLVKSARENGRSICAEAYARYDPKWKAPGWAVRAATNVFSEGASLVPAAYRNATEFRSPWYRGGPGKGFRLVGQLSRRGNVFYEPA